MTAQNARPASGYSQERKEETQSKIRLEIEKRRRKACKGGIVCTDLNHKGVMKFQAKCFSTELQRFLTRVGTLNNSNSYLSLIDPTASTSFKNKDEKLIIKFAWPKPAHGVLQFMNVRGHRLWCDRKSYWQYIDLDRLALRLIKERARVLLERVHRLENETNYLKFIKLNQLLFRLAPLINLIFTSNNIVTYSTAGLLSLASCNNTLILG